MGSFFSTPSASQLRAAAQRQGASINWQHVLCPLLGNTPAATLLEKESGSEDTVFHNILRRSTNEQVMRALLARFDDHPEELKLVLCSRNRHGQSPLHLAIQYSSQVSLRLLIAQAQRVGKIKEMARMANSSGFTPLHAMCSHNPSVNHLNSYLHGIFPAEGGGVPEDETFARDVLLAKTSLDGFTPLLLLVRNMGPASDALEALLHAAGDDLAREQLTQTTNNGWNCLHFLFRYSRTPDAIQALCSEAVRLGVFDVLWRQQTADTEKLPLQTLCAAVLCDDTAPEAIKPFFDAAPALKQELLSSGPIPPLIAAAMCPNPAMTRFLAEEGAEMDQTCDVIPDLPPGSTALHAAALANADAVAGVLLEFGAFAAIVNDQGHLPSHYGLRVVLERAEEAAMEALPIKSAAKTS
eukprot:m.269574 g.269574  ORF g.269574 m.269574 type:complete len:411 (-) comp19304_c2_seq3:78-1310(-)